MLVFKIEHTRIQMKLQLFEFNHTHKMSTDHVAYIININNIIIVIHKLIRPHQQY